MNPIDLSLAFYQETIHRYEITVPNVHIGAHEWDICGVRKSGFIDEIEIKMTRSDFLADFKKQGQKRVPIPSSVSPERRYIHWKYIYVPKHELTASGARKCNYFWFLMPESLADKCMNDIPDHCGLMVAYYDRHKRLMLKEVKPAPRLHKRKDSEKNGFKYNIARKTVYRYWSFVSNTRNAPDT